MCAIRRSIRSSPSRSCAPILRSEGELAARFIQEARAAAAIVHPNIVQITDFGALPSGAPYFVMELLQGMSLSRMIRAGGPLPMGQAVRFLQQSASALAAAHAAGVIHRDLKPDNIHIAPNDTVKVLDFGVAKVAGAGRLTRTGMVFGSPHYMSPEQASGGEVDRRTDVYALGIIMYEMFTGRVPFEADSYMGVLTKHMFMVPEPPSRVSAASRELGALEDVVLRCLEKKPEARYESIDALIEDVEAIARFSGDRLEIAKGSPERKRRRAAPSLADELEPPARDELRLSRAADAPDLRTSRGAWGLAALAVAILIGGAVVALTRRPPSGDRSREPLAESYIVTCAIAERGDAAPRGVECREAGSLASALPAHSSARPPPSRPPSPRASGSRPAASAPPHPSTLGSPEIVNPWAN